MDLTKIEGMVKKSAANAGWPSNVVDSLKVGFHKNNLVAYSPHDTFDLEYGSEKSDPKNAIRKVQPDIEEEVSSSIEQAAVDAVVKSIFGVL